MTKIAITTSTFGQYSNGPIDALKKRGFELTFNATGKKLDTASLIKICRGCSGIIAGTEAYTKEVFEALPDLKVISRCGSGTDGIDFDEAQKRKIRVLKTENGPTRAVAELVIGLILDLLRNITLSDKGIRKGLWEKKMGTLFEGKTLGIIGMGKIGAAVSKLSMALGAKVIYFDPKVKDKKFGKPNNFTAILKNADIITVHVPGGKETLNLFGEKELSLMKSTSILINCSRGGVVEEKALYEFLKSGNIAAAASDVFIDEPYNGRLRELDNIVLTPHIGSYAKETRIEMENQAVKNLLKYLK
ncbi:MAG: phosphoglycerate dehydrogenase [Candidatus Omnitrophica bacterium]|nr:phosphoglycerate dehydrogenase [Candidatus Omnitrophota bacterium]